MGEKPWLAIAPMFCWLRAKQQPSWLSNPRQLLCKKGKETEKKGELHFLKCLLQVTPPPQGLGAERQRKRAC